MSEIHDEAHQATASATHYADAFGKQVTQVPEETLAPDRRQADACLPAACPLVQSLS